MSDRPVFIYEAQYDSEQEALDDYEALLDLHDLHLVGTYDAAVIRKDDNGKVHVHKHEKPTQHGAWTGVAVGALLGVLFPPSILASALIGGGAGAVIAHLARGMSRSDMKKLGELLDEGQAAIVVIGESRVSEQLDKALTRAQKTLEREVDADAKELQKDIEKEAAADR